jgi:hypothetical protein
VVHGRNAIAMMELIFAIVVMGIALLSIPNLVSTASRSGYAAIQQEEINEASSHLNMILSYPWDQNDTDEEYIPPILHTAEDNPGLDENSTTKRRNGTPLRSYRAFVRSDGNDTLRASVLGFDTGESKGDENDIDDFDGSSYHLSLEETSPVDYVQREAQIDINATVSYIDHNTSQTDYQHSLITYDCDKPALAQSSSVKMIAVKLESVSDTPELNTTITFKAFSCNIGGTELEERNFQ